MYKKDHPINWPSAVKAEVQVNNEQYHCDIMISTPCDRYTDKLEVKFNCIKLPALITAFQFKRTCEVKC